MCGIYGIFTPKSELSGRSDYLKLMSDRLVHRGPDADHWVSFPDIAMGTRRLAIISATGNAQPVHNEDRSIWGVMNGEIYNFRELRAKLSTRHHLAQSGDSELIVHLYEDLGAGFAEAIVGMFAVAIWDDHKKQLVLARDRLGEKPLYIGQNAETLVFASEMQSISGLPFLEPDLDLVSALRFITYGYVPGPRTMVRGVVKLPPATVRIVDLSLKSHDFSYWRIPTPDADDDHTEGEWLKALDNSLTEACISQYECADTPPAIFLSGGLDSSLITAILAERSKQPICTYTIGYADEPPDSDSFYAKQLAESYCLNHHRIVIGKNELMDSFSMMMRHIGEPCADTSAMPIAVLASIVAQSNRVVLTGGGADELFAGYPEHLVAAEELRQGANPHAVWNPLFPALALLSRQSLKELLSPAVLAACPETGHPAWVEIWSTPVRGADPLWQVLATDLRGRLPDLRLAFSDHMTMARSLETRSPFLDPAVVDIAMRMPSRYKASSAGGKWPLRQLCLCHNLVGQAARPKQGLPNPMFGRWYCQMVSPIWRSEKERLSAEFEALFVPGALDKVEQCAERTEEWGMRQLLWRLIILAAWLNLYRHQIRNECPSPSVSS